MFFEEDFDFPVAKGLKEPGEISTVLDICSESEQIMP
jgi:hypothetical protein